MKAQILDILGVCDCLGPYKLASSSLKVCLVQAAARPTTSTVASLRLSFVDVCRLLMSADGVVPCCSPLPALQRFHRPQCYPGKRSMRPNTSNTSALQWSCA